MKRVPWEILDSLLFFGALALFGVWGGVWT
jgi:hypothetical protein